MNAHLKAFVMAAVVLSPVFVHAGLVLRNGNFDDDPDLGGADETNIAPTGWFTHYTNDGSWSDFRFGNNGNGGWTNNGITLGQNYTPDPGPEDGYYYTSLGNYAGEVSATVSGRGYNRVNGNPAGSFEVALYYAPVGLFTGANGSDVADTGSLIGKQMVDISSITGQAPQSLPFTLTVPFAGSGILSGDEVWLRIGDGPDNGDLNNFDEPTIDDLTLTTAVPEPTGSLAAAGVVAALFARRRR